MTWIFIRSFPFGQHLHCTIQNINAKTSIDFVRVFSDIVAATVNAGNERPHRRLQNLVNEHNVVPLNSEQADGGTSIREDSRNRPTLGAPDLGVLGYDAQQITPQAKWPRLPSHPPIASMHPVPHRLVGYV